MSAWSHLKNAEHIDNILVHVKAHPEKWEAARNAAQGAAQGAAYGAAYEAAVGAVQAARKQHLMGVVGGAAYGEAYYVARNAILALIAYDNCGYMLKLPEDQVRVLAGLEVKGASLLLPAVIAMGESK